MQKSLFIATAIFLVFASPAIAADINISVEVVVPIGNYTNSSVNLSANQKTFINASEAGTTIELASSQNTSGAINLILTSTPLDIQLLSVPSLDKYLRIESSGSIKNNLTYVLIRLYYTDEEVNASGIEEGSLGFYWWNQNSSAWEKLSTSMKWVNSAGVDTIENYVWANVTHFSDYSVGGIRMPPSIKLIRNMPVMVRANLKFEMEQDLRNLADFAIYNISIKEKIPHGYNLRDSEKMSPRPTYIGEENGFTVIYWQVDRLPAHKSRSLTYSLFAPKSAGNYTFMADVFGFDAFNNKYAASNVTKQEVKKPPLWKSLLDFFGISQ
ncbi:MAG: hypothetical protein O8C64_16250 [Candidatus Methanoperedens sp.]|nr:hypothetical protein [Candidatus Methanoperedens sp.]MCZ7406122.1 hypothetical protein [Candidatus Methanoperedens sp.]